MRKKKKLTAAAVLMALCTTISFAGNPLCVLGEEDQNVAGVYGEFDRLLSQEAKQPGETFGGTETVGDKFGSMPESGNSLTGRVVGGAKASSGTESPSSTVQDNAVKSYKMNPVQDPQTGITVARCYAPFDYSTYGNVTWCGSTQSPSFPAQAYIYAVSPDENTAMGYFSPVSYYHLLDYSSDGVPVKVHQDGVFDTDCMLPMLSFHDAESYCDYVAEKLLQGQSIQFREQKEITQEQQQYLNAAAAKLQQECLQSGIVETGFRLDGTYCGEAMRTYSVNINGYSYLLTVAAATQGIQISSTVELLYSTMTSSYISWDALYAFYLLTPEAAYEDDFTDFEQFAMNTTISDEFISAMQALSQQIVRQMVLRSCASMDAIADYCMSSISSQVGSEASYTSDSFSDYILDQNDYTLPDGDHVKVSTAYDYVYTDDSGNIYVSDSAQEPAGTTQLYPN